MKDLYQKTWQDKVIERGMVVLLVFTPLAFGGVQVWAAAVMEIIAFSLLALLIAKRRNEEVWFPGGGLMLCMALVLGYAVFQLMPMPPGVLRALSASTAALHDTYGISEDGSWKPLSIYPWATQQELWKCAAYGSVFLVIVNHYQTKRQVKRLIKTIIVMAVFLTALAIIQKMTWNGRVLWFYPSSTASNARIWGPFINRNHFAGYLEMVIPLVLAMSFYRLARLRTDQELPLWKRLFSSADSRRSSRAVVYGMQGLFLTAVLFATLSRGAVLSLLASLIVFFALLRMRKGVRKRAGVFAMAGIALLLLLLFAGWERLEARFEQLAEERPLRRAEVWRDSLEIVKEFPLFGAGLGTFGNAYPRYQSHSSTIFYDHAHNDYVELLTDAGIIGMLLILAAAGMYAVKIVSAWRMRHGTFTKVIGVGGMASLCAMAFHSVVDFNLHIPANALLLTVIAGITYAVVVTNERQESNTKV